MKTRKCQYSYRAFRFARCAVATISMRSKVLREKRGWRIQSVIQFRLPSFSISAFSSQLIATRSRKFRLLGDFLSPVRNKEARLIFDEDRRPRWHTLREPNAIKQVKSFVFHMARSYISAWER